MTLRYAALDDLIATDGKDAWAGILLTHVAHHNSRFAAELETEPDFAVAKRYDTDILEGLSIGEIGVLYEYTLSKEDQSARKAAGAYFTPDDVSQVLASHAHKFPSGTWVDPCCGVGNLSHHLVAASSDPVQMLSRLTLVDLDARALLIARTLLCLRFDPRKQTWENMKVRNQNFLDYKIEEDFVLMNPPYAATVLDARFRSAKARDLYAYFIEKAATQAKGFISITPQSFTNATKFAPLRELLLEKVNAHLYIFDNMPAWIFKGVKFGSQNTNSANSVRAAIMVANPVFTEWKMTPMLRWTAVERAELLSSLDSFLDQPKMDRDIFAKTSRSLLGLLEDLNSSGEVLKDAVSKEVTEFSLGVPAAPRYFIPAVKRELSRSSLIKLNFADAATRDRWYVALNSSALYAWWRSMDGGMSLSHDTLMNFPFPPALRNVDDSKIAELARMLEASESDNLVVKMNAGKPNESVKHPLDVVTKLNEAVTPGYEKALAAEHLSSSLAAFRALT